MMNKWMIVVVALSVLGCLEEKPDKTNEVTKTIPSTVEEKPTPDGRSPLNKEEYLLFSANVMKKKGGIFKKKFFEDRFVQYDTDKDGKLSYEERKAGRETFRDARTSATNEVEIPYGIDYINLEEYVALAEKMAEEKGWKFNRESVENRFVEYDVNKDEKLSFEERNTAKNDRIAAKTEAFLN